LAESGELDVDSFPDPQLMDKISAAKGMDRSGVSILSTVLSTVRQPTTVRKKYPFASNVRSEALMSGIIARRLSLPGQFAGTACLLSGGEDTR
jgi:hypothetical protein